MKKLFLVILLLIDSIFTFSQQKVEICDDDNTIFTYSTSINSDGVYSWILNNGPVISNNYTVTIDWDSIGVGNHTLEVRFSDLYGCDPEPVYYIIQVSECQSFVFWIPNAFSPNEDLVNDYFVPKGFGFKEDTYIIRIFNRWGEEIYFSCDINEPWNGKYGDKYQEDGVYSYLITLKDDMNHFHEYAGRVTLLR